MKRRQFLRLGIAAAAAPAIATGRAAAQAKYPDRPIRFIVPFPPGGAYDYIGRQWAERVKGYMGNTVVVENMGGAGGGVGAAFVTRQRPDGYTLLLGGATTHITEALLKTKPTYDPLKDLEPVSGIAVTAFAITVHPSVPAKDLKELVAYVKANPGKLSYGSAGHGSLNHLTGELFKLRAGIKDLTHVPYRGAGPALNDILAGQIPMIVPAMTATVQQHHETGKLRILAVTHGTRLKAAPNLPTAVEQGFPDVVAPNYIGLYFPTGTPKEIVEHVGQANLKLMADKSFQDFLVKGTFEIEPPLSTAKYKEYVESEIRRWRPIVSAMGVKID
ncbi:MAG: tripartite tricarboxylate transporter substrate binding protein [Alphaproteobacteria bacterium]|nr:tripartite tricarboxylate transporter substrate binding protein [Alphaproteobacteria bacterium]